MIKIKLIFKSLSPSRDKDDSSKSQISLKHDKRYYKYLLTGKMEKYLSEFLILWFNQFFRIFVIALNIQLTKYYLCPNLN